ncbi:hypothetical protein OSB04_024313 [Centaurea solstitialis]|uniref:Integrase catalytic domain-containing protein n=1 Tax=Centaurea solstitialis TaxID=347529 RepID=A0AA38SZ81_9ASTR|nr:hypothetical protein OSB04_024313 [Centaurea solstitialis]
MGATWSFISNTLCKDFRLERDRLASPLAIDIAAEEVRNPSGGELIVYDEGRLRQLVFCSVTNARKYLQHRCVGYLAYTVIGSAEENELSVTDIPVVSEYPDVVPEDLPSIPPDSGRKFMNEGLVEDELWSRLVLLDTCVSYTGGYTLRLQGPNLGTKLHFSTAYHPQANGQSEHTIQTLGDMLRACVLDFGGSWDAYLLLAEFSYNNSFYSSFAMPPYEMFYGRMCRTPICWGEVGQRVLGSQSRRCVRDTRSFSRIVFEDETLVSGGEL